MSWTSSFFVAALTGALGLIVAGLVTAACSEWLHVSSREGAAGYLMVAVALVGGAVAFVLGLGLSRMVAGMPEPGFFKALGISCGAVLALGGGALGLGWLKADFSPKIDGQNLELAIEVRTPKGFVLPKRTEEYGIYACVRVAGSRRYQPRGELALADARQENGGWLVSAVVPLGTSSSNKVLDVHFSDTHDLSFRLPLRSHPSRSDTEWSAWVDSAWDVGQAEPPKEKKFNLRYQVQLVVPPPPAEDPATKEAAAEQAKFDALGAHSPIQDWFPAIQYGTTDARWAIAVGHITARPSYVAELSALMVATEDELATGALSLVPRLPSPQPALLAPMATAGRHIAELIRKFNATTPEQDPNQRGADSVAARFGAWSDAARALREKSGGDFTPELGEILKLSRVRTDSNAMRTSVRRVASYWLKQWANIDPLPGDPPPR